MKQLLAILAIPFSLAGSLAITLEFYSRTAEAQQATSVLITSLSQLSTTIPKLILFAGFLCIFVALAYLIVAFSRAGANRVNAQTQLMTQSHLRLAGRGSIVGQKMIDNGYNVITPRYDIILPKEN